MISLILFLFALIGCDSIVNQNSNYDYSIEQKVGCFYCPESGEWVKLFIDADTIAAAFRILDNYKLPNDEIRNFKSIKGLFNAIAETDTNKYILMVKYNLENNYPSFLYLEPKPIIVNDTTTVIIEDAQIAYYTQNYIKLK